MPSKKNNSNKSVNLKDSTTNISSLQPDLNFCYEGESLSPLLQKLCNGIESERQANKVAPDKFWLKQQFAIGVNEVTRLLERMTPLNPPHKDSSPPGHLQRKQFTVPVKLQAVLVASDCNPRWLTKHLPALAASRDVPLIHIKHNKEGSLKLGELFRLKTAIAIGVKAKESGINKLFEVILQEDEQISGRRTSTGDQI